jgi:uncharacterized phage protein gp47/JayE
MPSYGLQLEGFVPKPQTVIKQELDAVYKATFGAQLGSEPDGSIPADSVAGQRIGLHAERMAELWEIGQALGSSFDPDAATGRALDILCAITGATRNQERSTTGTVALTGDPATLVPASSVISIPVVGTRFDTDANATLVALAVWTVNTAYALGDRVTNGASPARVYQAVAAGTSALAGTGPSGTGSSIVDASVTWSYVGEGTAAVDVTFTALDSGPFAALTGQITSIESPVSGWLSVRNMNDALVGAYVETDASLRNRREAELAGRGNGPLPAIRADLLKVGQGTANAVVDCVVFENVTDVVDAFGIPAHSFEAVVLGGLDADIRQTIFDTKPAGIRPHGGVTGIVVDSTGISHTIKFSRPTTYSIWIEIDVTYNAATWPLDGPAQVKAAILAALTPANGYTLGKDVTSWGIGAAVDVVPGVLNVTAIRLGTAPAPMGTADIPIGIREVALFDSARILVTSVAGTP